MKGIAETVDQSVAEQTRGTGVINERVREIGRTIDDVRTAADSQIQAVNSVVQVVGVLRGISERNDSMTQQLGEVIKNLGERAEKLKDETDKFTV